MRRLIKIFLLYSIIFLVVPVSAQVPDSVVRIDHQPVEQRTFGKNKITELKQDADFDYSLSRMPGKGFWEMLWDWIVELFRKIFSFKVGQVSIGKLLIYTLCILTAAYAIYKLIQTRTRILLKANEESDMPYNIHEENIHVMDFENLIREAKDNKQYRHAIRLIYLYALKKLADGQHIHWQPGKTNHDYLKELQEERLQKGFVELSYYFDYAWYGEFEVKKHHLDRVTETFAEWRKEVRT